MKSKSAIVLSKIIEKIQLIVGAFLILLFGLGIIMMIVDKNGLDGIIMCAIFTGLGIWLVILSNKRKKLALDFRTYVARLSTDPTGSIENLAQGLGTSQDVVINNLQKMIIKKYFANAYIDSMNNRIVLAHVGANMNNTANTNTSMNNQNATETEYISVTCNSCGGINKITNGKVGECEYCGSPINR